MYLGEQCVERFNSHYVRPKNEANSRATLSPCATAAEYGLERISTEVTDRIHGWIC